jgi:hypothetical protein
MTRYFVETPHTPEECLRALDEVLAQGPQALARYDWGCAAGIHAGFTTVEAESADQVRAALPELERAKARIVPLNKFTAEQIATFHSS